MPISEYYKGKGEKVLRDMKRRYGPKAGERVFYATANKKGLTPEDDRKATEKALDVLRKPAR
jgi:ribosomal protein S27AE